MTLVIIDAGKLVEVVHARAVRSGSLETGSLGLALSDLQEIISDCITETRENYITIQKPEIPEYVAEWVNKFEDTDLNDLFDFNYSDELDNKVANWLYDIPYEQIREREDALLLARAIGYVIESPKMWHLRTVNTMLAKGGEEFLIYDKIDNTYYMDSAPENETKYVKGAFTEEELEDMDESGLERVEAQ